MEHHERAIERFCERMSVSDAVVAIVVSGSVARGDERPDSDIDVYLVVTEHEFDRARTERRLSYVTGDDVDYEGGYVDVKVASVEYLRRAVTDADDPTRASFIGSRLVWTGDDEVADLVAQIPRLDDDVFAARARSFVAQARLQALYFLPHGHEHGDPFLLHHAAVHLVLASGRALLAHHRRFFQGQKYLYATLDALPGVPDGFTELMRATLEDPSPTTAGALLTALEGAHDWDLGFDETISTFVEDNELAWLTGRVPPEYR